MKNKYLFSVLMLLLFAVVNSANAEMYTQSLNIGGNAPVVNQGSSQTYTYSQLPSSNLQTAAIQEVVPQNVTINNKYYYPISYPAYGRNYINTVPYYSRTYPTYSGYLNRGGVNVGINSEKFSGGYTFKGGYDFSSGSKPIYVNRPSYNPPPNNGGLMPPRHMPDRNNRRGLPPMQPGVGTAGFSIDW